MPKSGKSKKRDSGLSSDMYDEIDNYIEKRSPAPNGRSLTKKSKKGPNSMEASRTILDLEMSQSDSLDESDPLDNESVSSEQAGSEDETQKFDDRKWGSKKQFYHQTVEEEDVSELSGSDAEDIAEEAEALRMQKRKAAERREDDFDDSFAVRATGTKKSSSKSKSTVTSTDAGLLESMYKDLSKSGASGLITADGRDLSALSKQEKLDLITKDSPELLLLLDSFTAKVQEIRERLAPLIQRARAQQIPTSKGLSYLEAKYHLLLNYCTNVCFYLLLKAEGKSVKNHPVIEHLARTRLVIDRLKPLDQKLKYQVDKLLKAAVQGEASDPKLKHRANIRGFVPMEADNDEDDVSENDEDGEELASANAKYVVPKFTSATTKEERKQKQREKKAKSSAMAQYLLEEYGDAPLEHDYSTGIKDKSILAEQREREAYEEDNFVRLATSKKEKQAVRAANAGAFVDELADLADFGDLAALDYDRGNVLEKAADLEAKALSKKRKKSVGDASEDRLAAVMDSIDARAAAASAKTKSKHSVDDDIDYLALKEEKKAKKQKVREAVAQAEEDQHRIDSAKRERDAAKQTEIAESRKKKERQPAASEAFDDDDDFYKEAALRHQTQKEAKEQEKLARKAAREAQVEEDHDDYEDGDENGAGGDEEVQGDGHRKVTSQIEENARLKKHAKAEKRNSRVKHKKKYETALKNMRGRGRVEADKARIFTGDAPSINKRVVKSTAL